MNNGEIFSILEIERTKDKEAIRAAYMKKLSITNPEDDPEGFKILRTAYEEAMRLADEAEDNSPIGLWMKRVEEAYSNFDLRLDKWTWEEILEDEVCGDAGTYNDAREAIFRFIMGNSYLPGFVFEMINSVFKTKEDYEELCEGFPQGFIDFLLRLGNGINMELITAKSGQDADTCCNLWFEYRNAAAEDNKEKIRDISFKYSQIPCKMPYFDADIAIDLLKLGEMDRAKALLNTLDGIIGRDGYISAACAEGYLLLKDYKKAAEVCNLVEEKYPGNNRVRMVRAGLLEAEGKIKEAKKLLEDIYKDNNEPYLFEKLQEINKKLVKELEGSHSFEDKMELGWCYYQNGQNKELMELMDSIKPQEEKDFAMYYNLRSRALLAAERFEEALECIEKWREALDRQAADNEDEENDRRRRIVLSAFFAARCLRIMADKSGDESYREQALEKAKEPMVCEEKGVLLQLWLERAAILKELERYDEAIDLCSEITAEDSVCFPAYAIRQECYFELRNPGAVLDDYRRVLDIMPDINYAPLYAVAAHIFLTYDRYDSALEVIKRGEENGAVSDYLTYVKASTLRYMAKNSGDTLAALKLLEEIEKKPKEERVDFNKKRNIELYEEICFAYMDLEQWDKADEAIDKAIELEPENIERYRTKLDIYNKAENKAAAEKCLAGLKRKFGKHPFVYYEQAKRLEDNNRAKAISLYKQAFKIDEGYRDTASRLRELYQREYLTGFKDSDFKTAMEYADKNIELYPYSRQYLERGILYMGAGMGARAEADFKKAVEQDEEYILALEWLGDSLRIQEKHKEAIGYYKEAYSLAKGNGNYFPPKDYALGLEALCEYEKSIEILLEMTEDFPDEAFVWYNLGRVYQKAWQREKAWEAYIHYITVFEHKLGPRQVSDAVGELIDIAYYTGIHHKELFDIISDEVEKSDKSPWAYLSMARYFCYLKKDKKQTGRFITRAMKRAKALNDNYALRECYRKALELYFCLGENAKIKLTKMTYNQTIDKAQVYKDKRYLKTELYIAALQLYLEGDKKTAFKMFADMQQGCNCQSCYYSQCVENVVGKALILAEKGNYAEALDCFEQVLKEDFDTILMLKFIERIKEKM